MELDSEQSICLYIPPTSVRQVPILKWCSTKSGAVHSSDLSAGHMVKVTQFLVSETHVSVGVLDFPTLWGKKKRRWSDK